MVLPVYAALERIPDRYLEASRTSAGRPGGRSGRVILPLALPGLVAGSIFTFALTLGDYITPTLVGGGARVHRQRRLRQLRHLRTHSVRRCVRDRAAYRDGVYLLLARRLGAFEAL